MRGFRNNFNLGILATAAASVAVSLRGFATAAQGAMKAPEIRAIERALRQHARRIAHSSRALPHCGKRQQARYARNRMDEQQVWSHTNRQYTNKWQAMNPHIANHIVDVYRRCGNKGTPFDREVTFDEQFYQITHHNGGAVDFAIHNPGVAVQLDKSGSFVVVDDPHAPKGTI